MRFEDRVIDEVQAAYDIVDVIQQVVPLKRAGRNFKANCPFHDEKTASFMVSPVKQIYHCFGCGAGGNLFSFKMRYDNATFPEVLRELAEKANIRLPEPTGRDLQTRNENEQLYEVYKLAESFYRAQYRNSGPGQQARDYIHARKFSQDIQEEFQIGWAPAGWTSLFDHLSKKGYSNELLLKSGLIHRSPKGSFYDSFRGRVMIPIRNLQGKVVAFGGRVLKDQEGPKYLNSPENPIFFKRRELFGLDKAKRFINRDLPQLLIVEGYFDFLRLYQSGIQAVAATLGTALTNEHVRLLKRFADEAVVIYDGDNAGQAASLRGLDVFLQEGMSVKLVTMPKGSDPDDFVATQGPDALRQMVDSARDFFDFKLEALSQKYNRSDSAGLMKMTGEFLDTFQKVQSPILLSHYLRRLSASLGVDENTLRSELDKLKQKDRSGSKPVTSVIASKGQERPTDEILILALALDETAVADRLCKELSRDDFQDSSARAVYAGIQKYRQESKTLSWAQVLNRLQDGAARDGLLAASNIDWSEEDRNQAFADCLKRIRNRHVEDRRKELRQQISQAEQAGNQDLLERYLKEYQSLMKLS